MMECENNMPTNCDTIKSILEDTFKSNCSDLETAYPTFMDLLSSILELPIIDGYADYRNESKNIHLNLFLEDELRLVIDKNVNDDVSYLSIVTDSNIYCIGKTKNIADAVNMFLLKTNF